jgi:branched-chain amino acid transport system permease protein
MRTVQQLINGVAIGGVYALFATGYTLVFSVLRIVNLAHGAVFTMGAYLTYLLMGSPVGTVCSKTRCCPPLDCPSRWPS